MEGTSIVALILVWRRAAQAILKLPEQLVKAHFRPQEMYLKRKMRVAKLKELVELREIGKALTAMYSFKGNLMYEMHEVYELAEPFTEEDWQEIRIFFHNIVLGIEDIENILKERGFSNTKLATKAAQKISECRRIYIKLENLPSDTLSVDQLREIAATTFEMNKQGHKLIEKLDAERARLDHTYN